jgi:3-methyladenine DNA glycosylase/8-oxoguanine DNA glycosylase
MPVRTIRTPADYLLYRDACSYGYFLLAPNRWDVAERALLRTFSLPRGPVAARITQPGGAGGPLKVATGVTLSARDRAALESQVRRMLRLDEDEGVIAAFHRRDPRWKKSGRGRLFRSPTLLEDVIKTVTSCNVTWPSTVHMNRRLCEVLGESPGEGVDAGFPAGARLARARVQTLRARCRVGYRDQRIIDLARLLVPGVVAWMEDPATAEEDLHAALLELPGVGPYAAANIMQLLGRYSRLPLDTESVRHGRTVLGMSGTSAAVMKQVRAHFEPFGEHAFRSYWFEMWTFYESKHGPAWTWERDSTGKLFTAALLSK